MKHADLFRLYISIMISLLCETFVVELILFGLKTLANTLTCKWEIDVMNLDTLGTINYCHTVTAFIMCHPPFNQLLDH